MIPDIGGDNAFLKNWKMERDLRLSRILALMACIGGIGLPLEAASAAGDREIIVSVPGIPGPYCAYGVEKRFRELDGVKRVDLLWEEETIRAELVEGAAITREQIMEAMKKADYPYEYTIKKP